MAIFQKPFSNRPPSAAATAVCFSAALALLVQFAAGCERHADASRALLAERRASWGREIAALKSQHAALLARSEGLSGLHAAAGPSQQRMHVVLDGARQSIADVEIQLAQVESRVEPAIRRGGQASEQAINDESARARSYLQGLGEQLSSAARQLDVLASSDDEAKRQSP